MSISEVLSKIAFHRKLEKKMIYGDHINSDIKYQFNWHDVTSQSTPASCHHTYNQIVTMGFLNKKI